jgi:hypothetical protein
MTSSTLRHQSIAAEFERKLVGTEPPKFELRLDYGDRD